MKKYLLALLLLASPLYGAMQDFVPTAFVPQLPTLAQGAASHSTIATLDAVDEKVAFIIQVPKTGNVRNIAWRCGGASAVHGSHARLESASATGVPSGNLMCALSSGTIGLNGTGAAWLISTNFTSDCAVVRGSTVAVVIVSTDTVTKLWSHYGDNPNNMPFVASSTSASGYTKAVAGPTIGLGYDDGTYPFIAGNIPAETFTTVTVATNTTPNVVGNRFQFPTDTVVTGAWLWADMDADGDIVLYAADDNVILATATTSTNFRGANTGAIQFYYFTSSVTLTADTFYRVAYRGLTTSSISVYRYDADSQEAFDGLSDFGPDMYYTSARTPTGTGSWTDVTTSRAFIGLIVSGFNVPTGSGGGTLHAPFIQ